MLRPMELLLIRHALPIRREDVDGPADPELSEAGRDQSMHLAQWLADERLDAVYASPMQRRDVEPRRRSRRSTGSRS